MERVETELSDKVSRKRTETMDSLPSDMYPGTPPFTIKNKDLVQTHGKYRDIVPTLDFEKLKKKRSKSKKKKSPKKLVEEPQKQSKREKSSKLL